MRTPNAPDITADFVQRLRCGDREAFDVLTGSHERRLLSLIRLRLGDAIRTRLDPEDVLQMVLLKAYQALPGLEWRGEAGFVAWLTTIAENVCTDSLREHCHAAKNSVWRERSLDRPVCDAESGVRLIDLLSAGAPTPSRGLRREERLERLERALDQLTPQHREVLVLSVVRMMPTREVAEQLGLTSGAVCMLRTRAIGKLGELFGDTESLRLPDHSLDTTLGWSGCGGAAGDEDP
jgi:RNA polymerase sigma-70 factor (subfamily 1)